MMEDLALDDRLSALAEQLRSTAPLDDSGAPATLAALLPCEPAVGEVAVVCWVGDGDGEHYQLVRLDDGAVVDDAVALREALTLLAMTETLEELASFDRLLTLDAELAEWHAAHPGDATWDAAFVRARESMQALAALDPGASARIARPSRLDDIGNRLRELERAWELLEQAAELWSDAHVAAVDGDTNAPIMEQVRELWSLLGHARSGPLARPASSAVHDGRESGRAMAAAIAEAAHR